jgi:uncharacterized protein with von Willebrand factor type A (vWA) domain
MTSKTKEQSKLAREYLDELKGVRSAERIAEICAEWLKKRLRLLTEDKDDLKVLLTRHNIKV